ncbi:DNA-binding XRE family transcriptional regulator [Azospirillum fermentarium]|uniref:helix-turn-helix domain-containing protein n=1 Tax=Azospirillum fermentarium TaxID=1233114 RepID=UPI0022268CE4|nr:helix-turn-helix domain-containing protein [Azospirillum fermentarium]MCW2244954.1 DNA-binding XRE family transcriptional regulator [Azospirillum fermentarium]
MSGRHGFSALRDGMTPERQARIAAKTDALRQEMALGERREARRRTQASLGETLNVDQSAIAKMEKRTDMYVSNLRRFIQAMGGELRVVAHFPKGDVVITNFADAGDGPPHPRP